MWSGLESAAPQDVPGRLKSSVDVHDPLPVAFAFVSDQHVGGACDYKRMREDAELIASTPGVFAVLGGDGCDNHVKHWAAVLASNVLPDEQVSAFEHYLDMFGEKVVAMISGNHDLWTLERAGVDVVRRIAARRGLLYGQHEHRILLRHHGAEYRLWIRHKGRFNSGFNSTHSHKQHWRTGEHAWDVGCICHLHEAALEPFWAHGEVRWACRPGSYLVRDPYAESIGFNAAVPSCPTFVFYPTKKRVVGFLDVREALVYLREARHEKGAKR
ncbi:MAG: hypothetical protein GHCLOJNM_01588 [bacterium]|nr:hypothetical protein [bacterium]